MAVWYKNPVFLSVSYGILSAIATALTPYAASSLYVGVIVTLINLVDSHISAPIAPSNPQAPNPSSPSNPASNSNSGANFTLDCNTKTPKIGDSFILSIANGSPNGTATIFELENLQPITVAIQLDNNGNGSMNVNNLSTLSPLGFIINTQGSIDLVAIDTATGKRSNTITLT